LGSVRDELRALIKQQKGGLEQTSLGLGTKEGLRDRSWVVVLCKHPFAEQNTLAAVIEVRVVQLHVDRLARRDRRLLSNSQLKAKAAGVSAERDGGLPPFCGNRFMFSKDISVMG